MLNALLDLVFFCFFPCLAPRFGPFGEAKKKQKVGGAKGNSAGSIMDAGGEGAQTFETGPDIMHGRRGDISLVFQTTKQQQLWIDFVFFFCFFCFREIKRP